MYQMRGGGGGGGQRFVYQKWPDQIFPTVNSVFSCDGPFGWGQGGPAGAWEGGGGGSSDGVRPFQYFRAPNPRENQSPNDAPPPHAPQPHQGLVPKPPAPQPHQGLVPKPPDLATEKPP